MPDTPENTAAVAPIQYQCKPLFECLAEEWDNEWAQIHALSEEWAAKKYVEDRDDYYCEGPTERVLVRVRRIGEHTERVFSVSGEVSVCYLAREVTMGSKVPNE